MGKSRVNYTARKVHIAVELSFGFSAGLEDVMQVCESVQTLMPTDAKRHQIHPTWLTLWLGAWLYGRGEEK